MNKFSSLFRHLQVKTIHLYLLGIFLFSLANWLTISERQKKYLRKRSRTVFLDKDAYNLSSSDSHSPLSQTQRPDSVTVRFSVHNRGTGEKKYFASKRIKYYVRDVPHEQEKDLAVSRKFLCSHPN